VKPRDLRLVPLAVAVWATAVLCVIISGVVWWCAGALDSGRVRERGRGRIASASGVFAAAATLVSWIATLIRVGCCSSAFMVIAPWTLLKTTTMLSVWLEGSSRACIAWLPLTGFPTLVWSFLGCSMALRLRCGHWRAMTGLVFIDG
jgi:hypothetical protein